MSYSMYFLHFSTNYLPTDNTIFCILSQQNYYILGSFYRLIIIYFINILLYNGDYYAQ